MTEHFETGSRIVRRGRGMAQKSLDLIEAMYAAAETAQPITGRGIGYKLFTQGLIASMGRADMQRVYLAEANYFAATNPPPTGNHSHTH